jgi:hypothetical protein
MSDDDTLLDPSQVVAVREALDYLCDRVALPPEEDFWDLPQVRGYKEASADTSLDPLARARHIALAGDALARMVKPNAFVGFEALRRSYVTALEQRVLAHGRPTDSWRDLSRALSAWAVEQGPDTFGMAMHEPARLALFAERMRDELAKPSLESLFLHASLRYPAGAYGAMVEGMRAFLLGAARLLEGKLPDGSLHRVNEVEAALRTHAECVAPRALTAENRLRVAVDHPEYGVGIPARTSDDPHWVRVVFADGVRELPVAQ